MNASGHKLSPLVIILAIFDSLLFAVLVAALLWRAVPDQNRELVSAAAGFIAGWVSAMRSFLTGSTAGSEAKTQALADNAKTLASNAAQAAGGNVAQMDVKAENVEITK